MHHPGDDLPLLMPLPRHREHIAGSQIVQRRLDGFGAIPDLARARTPLQDVGADRLSCLAAGIVVGDDDAIGEPRRRLAHQRPLAAIAVAAGAEDEMQLTLRVRPQGPQQAFQRVRGMGVIDISSGPVGQPRRQLHPPPDPRQTRSEIEDRVQSEHKPQTRGDQHVIGLKASRQVQPDVPAGTGDFQNQVLPIGARRGGDQTEQGPAVPHGMEMQPARDRSGAQGFQRDRVHAVMRDQRRTRWQQGAGQTKLGGAIRRHGHVIIQVVAGQIGEPGGRQPHPVQPVLIQPVRRGLHRHMLNPLTREIRQGLREADRIWRGQSRTGRITGRDGSQGPDTGRLTPVERPELAQKLDRAGLAVGAGDRDHGFRADPRQHRGNLRHQTARLGVDQQYPRWHIRRPMRAGRRQHGDGAVRHGVPDVMAPIHDRATHRDEQISRPDPPAIGLDPPDLQPRHCSGQRPAVAGQGQNLAEDVSEQQGAMPRKQSRPCVQRDVPKVLPWFYA